MTNRDYTKEVGLPSQKKTVSRPIAYAILALVAVGVSFGVFGVVREAKAHHAAEKKLEQPAKAEPAKP